MRMTLAAILLFVMLSACARFRQLAEDSENRDELRRLRVRAELLEGSARFAFVSGDGHTQPLRIDFEGVVSPENPYVEYFASRSALHVLVWEDTNGDRFPDLHERQAVANLGEDWDDDEVLTLRLGWSARPRFDLSEAARDSVLHVETSASLDDPRFSRENSELGVWQPFRFINEFGAGLFCVREFDPARIPVVFVHGYNGTPAEFESLIAGLPSEFQPWVAHYPSGWDLQDLSRYFAQLLGQLQQRAPGRPIGIVAHSMGGAISFHALGLVEEEVRVRSLITIASPLTGSEAARLGVRNAPAVVPSWRSLARGSRFLAQLEQTSLPEETSYSLLFALEDEVVPLEDQLPPFAQAEADRMRGFRAGHVTVLADPALHEWVGARLQADLIVDEVHPPPAPRSTQISHSND